MNVTYMGSCVPEMMGQANSREIPVVSVAEAKELQKAAHEVLQAAQAEYAAAVTVAEIAGAEAEIKKARVGIGIANTAYGDAMHRKGFIVSQPGTAGESAELDLDPSLKQPAWWQKMTWKELLPWGIAAGVIGSQML